MERFVLTALFSLGNVAFLSGLSACTDRAQPRTVVVDEQPPPAAVAGAAASGGGGMPPVMDTPPPMGGTTGVDGPGGVSVNIGETSCQATTCTELGWACGYFVDDCDNQVNCADEGLSCAVTEVCTGGIGTPTECVNSLDGPCELCKAIPDCSAAPQLTQLTGRVITPGRDDANVANQLGVPNAHVYILRNNNAAELPPITSGIPAGGTSCERCEDQELGPVLVDSVTDPTGQFMLEGYIPVGVEMLLVVKAGKFRRAIPYTLPATAACQTTTLLETLPDNPTRLPRDMADGVAVNIPRIAVSTGRIDAMECVLEKIGISDAEFGNPADGSAVQRIHLYRGGPTDNDPPVGTGARIDDTTPHADTLYGDLARLQLYDMVIADCEGQDYDSDFAERDASGANVREYVNRGGRMFASHLSFTWLHENGMDPYALDTAVQTGLGPAAQWSTNPDATDTSTGQISLGRPAASPRIDDFAAWMEREGIAVAPDYTFEIIEPRSQATDLGDASEEFVFSSDMNGRVQQFSFNTPYGAPEEEICGRVAYSGFHVSVGGGLSPFETAVFPEHCAGDLIDQEKVLAYMLFDVSACVGDTPPPPPCTPDTCDTLGAACGFSPDGCGNVLDCGPCVIQ